MANKIIRVDADTKTSKSLSNTEFKRYRDIAGIQDIKRDVSPFRLFPTTDAESKLRNAIADTVRRGTPASEASTFKEAKQHRRELIVKTILRHIS